MKKIFLASEINVVASHLAEKLNNLPLKTVFINTAAEPVTGDKQWLDDNKRGLVDAGFDVFDYTITDKSYEQLEKDLTDVEVIHVNGGNSFYLLSQIRKSGFDRLVKKQLEKGVIYFGSSAGSIVASPNIEITKKLESQLYADELKTFEGMGLVDFIILPHWGREGYEDFYLNNRLAVAYQEKNKIILLNDHQYVQVEGDSYRIVDARED